MWQLPLVLAFIITDGVIATIPISQNQVPLSVLDINSIMQSLWMSLLLVNMWFRRKGNYFMHSILAIAVVSITIISCLGVLILSSMNSNSMNEYFASTVEVALLSAHSIVLFPVSAFGVGLWEYGDQTRHHLQ